MEQANISLNALVAATQKQVSTSLEDEAVILHLEKGVYYGLNPVGSRIWNLLQAPRTVRDIRDIILQEFEVEPQRCEDDLLRLLQELSDKGLIEVKGGTNP